MDIQEKLQYISSYTGKLLRHKFGKGPQGIFASTGFQFLVIHIRGFLSPMEEVLMTQGHAYMVETARDAILQGLLEELKGVIQVTLDVLVTNFYNDWNFPNNSGMIVAILDTAILTPDGSQFEPLPDQGLLKQEIARLSALVEKVPEEIVCYPINPKVYLFLRFGILIPIEKALIHKGFVQELRATKDELEKTYCHREGQFEAIFGQPIQDIFIDWSMANDNSIVCFVMKTSPACEGNDG